MAENTAIEWADATFNPWWGCQKVSPACDHCYAERDAKRFAPGRVLWGVGAERRTFGDAHWQAPLQWAKQRFGECMSCRWRGPASKARLRTGLAGFDRDPGAMHCCPSCKEPLIKEARMRVFCASMADWLDLDAPLDEFVRLLDTIRRTPELDWLLLSKRIGNWRKLLEDAHARIVETEGSDSPLAQWCAAWIAGDAPANVILMATVINQEEYDRDIGKLLRTPARRRGLSIEPMLGPIDMRMGGASMSDYAPHRPLPRLDWVIAGGESGPHARPTHPDWFRALRDQCAAAGVPFLFKQWGEWFPDPDDDRGAICKGITRAGALLESNAAFNAHVGDAELMFRIGKKAAGRLLDGVEHNGFPG